MNDNIYRVELSQLELKELRGGVVLSMNKISEDWENENTQASCTCDYKNHSSITTNINKADSCICRCY